MRTEPVFGSLAQTCRLHSKSPLSGLECNQNVTPTRAPDAAGCEPLDDIAEDHVTYSDRRAEDRGQNKVHTADDRCHGSSLGNELTPYLWNTHECNNYKVTFGTRPVQLPGQPQTGKDAHGCCVGAVLRFTNVRAGRDRVFIYN